MKYEQRRNPATVATWRRSQLGLLLGCCGLLLSGCGGQPYELANVSGTVTLNGKPFANASVAYQPIAEDRNHPMPGPGSFGRTDANGHYSLRTVDTDAEGAVVGKHRITITSPTREKDPSDDRILPEDAEKLPEEWWNGSKTFTVPEGGTDSADFKIES